jgi:hypothetical protein
MSHDCEKKCLDDRIIVDTSSRPAVPWSSIEWKAKGSAGAWRVPGHTGVALAHEEP